MGIGDALGRVRTRASATWQSLKQRRPSVAHAVRAYQHYKSNRGDHLAAAITYFSFLAIFPLILLGVSVVGFVLASHPSLQNDLYNAIYRNAPGAFGNTLKNLVQGAVRNRASVGLIGLFGVLFAGLGWVANLRTAIDTVWGLPPAKRNPIVGKLADSLVLLGLGIGGLISVGLTAGGTAAGGALLRWLNLSGTTGAGTVTAVLGSILGILGSMVIFGWLLIGLPQVHVSRRIALRTTFLAAIGFEALKLVGTYYISRVIKSPAGAAIGPLVGILVWMDLVSRFLLYSVAWAATAEPVSQPEPVADEAPVGPSPTPPVRPLSPLGVAAALLSTGAAIGAAFVALLQRRRTSPARSPR